MVLGLGVGVEVRVRVGVKVGGRVVGNSHLVADADHVRRKAEGEGQHLVGFWVRAWVRFGVSAAACPRSSGCSPR